MADGAVSDWHGAVSLVDGAVSDWHGAVFGGGVLFRIAMVLFSW
ncbi:hypothetical protein NSQ77_11025 [Oceanobacillus sp. FSL K6-2867]